MREIDEMLKRRPNLGTLVGEAQALRAQLSRQRGASSAGAPVLTTAELRGLPLLASHLPAAEIAAELFVSVHTVKSQQASLYRKLGTSSRSQAVGRARGGRGLQVINALATRWDCFLLAGTRVVWCDFGQPLRAAPGDAWAWLRLVLPGCDLSPPARPASAVAPGALTGVAR